MTAFFIANPLRHDGAALRQRFLEDGYIFLKCVVDPRRLLELRAQITELCARHGWLKPGSDPQQAIAWTSAKVEGEEAYFALYDEVQKLEALHALPHGEDILAVMRALLDDSAFPHPLSIARFMFPEVPEWATPPHQDYPNNQGTTELYACWLPLGDCPRALGGLSILRGSHRFGLLPLEFALGPGHRRAVMDERLAGLEWVEGDFAAGDLIVFHSLTLHRSLPNTTDRLRLSVDYRFQREGDPLTEACLLPHFNRLSWDAIYQNWQRDDLKYYWRSKRYPIVPWDAALHDLPETHIKEALRRFHAFDLRRAELQRGYDEGAAE